MDIKSDLFESIADEKKRRIMEAALVEFAAKGYAGATTRNITNAAGISSGLLFYYFKDKSTLMIEVARHCRDFMVNTIFKELDDGLDFFDMLKQTGMIKVRIAVEYPEVYRLLLDDRVFNAPEFKRENNAMIQEFSKKYHFAGSAGTGSAGNSVDEGIQDRVIFKEGVDADLVKEIAINALEGISFNLTLAYGSGRLTIDDAMNIAIKKADDYIEFFRRNFTKC